MPYHPMKKHMDKLDDWGAQASKKLVQGRDAGPGVSMTDRLNLARGKDDRWNRFQAQRTGAAQDQDASASTLMAGPEGEDPNNIVPTRSTARAMPPSQPASFQSTGRAGVASTASKAAPPPPPPRTGSSGIGQATAATTAAKRPPPPTLPRRMDNEGGIDKPPPPYIPTSKPSTMSARTPSQASMPSSTSTAATGLGAVQFSRFTAEQKEEFFALLDEFFTSRSHDEGECVPLNVVKHIAGFPIDAYIRAKPSASSASSPRPKVSVNNAASIFAAGRPAHDTPSSSSSSPSMNALAKGKASESARGETAVKGNLPSYPRLGSSNAGVDEVCSALQCASFFVYRDSYPEWSGPAAPWYTLQDATPATIRRRNDLAWSMSKQYMGTNYTLLGSALFSDLSCLWWKITWNSTSPTSSVHVESAYKDRAESWNDEERLVEAQRGFGDWIAGFAEQAAQNRQPIGDGECWTLAAEAIKYTNTTAQLTEENRLLQSIGRTHGHLIFAGKADGQRGQSGRWRGGDRIRAHEGGIRRGDIVEWRTVKIRERGSPRGSYSTLGAPDHTAIVVENSPAPGRLSHSGQSHGETSEPDFYALLGIRPSASQAEIRSAYLQAARRHHPDRSVGHLGNTGIDSYMQQLNDANAILSDPTARQRYDEERASGQARSQSSTNKSRVSATVDLDAMEIVDNGAALAFHYPCRCGNGYYVDESQLNNVASLIAGCHGCSERIRVVADLDSAQQGVDVGGQAQSAGNEDAAQLSDDQDADQPAVAPWELDYITVIEQSAGQAPTRRTYDLTKDSFTQGEMWVYRPVWESTILGGGPVVPSWPPSLSGWQAL